MSAPAGYSRRASRLRSLASLFARPADSLLALRTLGWMCVLPVLKRVVALPRLVQLMWIGPSAAGRDREREKRAIDVVARLSRASGGNCLERSLILYRYLSQAGADPCLVVGMTRSNRYLGHVWVRVDGNALLETTDTLRAYAEVTAFGPEGTRVA
jgi:hypothetical protein